VTAETQLEQLVDRRAARSRPPARVVQVASNMTTPPQPNQPFKSLRLIASELGVDVERAMKELARIDVAPSQRRQVGTMDDGLPLYAYDPHVQRLLQEHLAP